MRTIVVIGLLFSSFSFSQVEDDTLVKGEPLVRVQRIETIDISLALIRIYRESETTFTRKEISELQATDVAELLQKMEGTTLKSYGGLGGLKTISVRSLGSQHSAVTVDGFNLFNNQTGQVNLGQLQTDNIERVLVGIGEQPQYMLPVTAQISGSSVLIETFENSYCRDTVAIRTNLKYGSYGRATGYAGTKWKFGKAFLSAYGKFRTANGNYQYRVQNGLQEDTSTRLNNDYQDYYAGATYGMRFENTQFRIGYKRKEIDQGLPGALILYNSSADERLTTKDQTLFADMSSRLNKNNAWCVRWYGSANQNDMRYQDPSFLNNSGAVDVNYLNRSVNTGLVTSCYTDKWMLHGGIEGTFSDLVATDSLFALPVRQHYSVIGGGRYRFGYLNVKAQVSAQYVHESNANGNKASDKLALNPYVSLEIDERWRFHQRHQLWYKNSFRMPSFNELYYNNIGNNGLTPERADQFGYNLSFVPRERNLDWHIRLGAFYNRVRDKIIATPTKNLFVWSMQNIGKVDVYGADVVSRLTYKFKNNRNIQLRSHVTYSYQRSLDVTDSEHPTYKHQIAYIPQHTVNFDLSFEYKKTGIRISNYYVSKRYSLNENIEANEVDAFIISDISLFHRFEWKEKHGITAQFNVKNVLDNSYSYIRSYVMPGRNYLISLSYAFN
ncbi:MAG: vitamin B12 transporter [Crocinitomicaceae bacterium]|jgi:vitamin B12 transporter